jgi:hypothetical protein
LTVIAVTPAGTTKSVPVPTASELNVWLPELSPPPPSLPPPPLATGPRKKLPPRSLKKPPEILNPASAGFAGGTTESITAVKARKTTKAVTRGENFICVCLSYHFKLTVLSEFLGIPPVLHKR